MTLSDYRSGAEDAAKDHPTTELNAAAIFKVQAEDECSGLGSRTSGDLACSVVNSTWPELFENASEANRFGRRFTVHEFYRG